MHIDYFKFQQMPHSKRKKLSMIAEAIGKQKLQALEKLGPMGASLI